MPAVKLSIKAYSAVDHDPHELKGFVKLGDTDIWKASYRPHHPEESRRGVNIMAINPVTLELEKNSVRTFDTHDKHDAARHLGKYLEEVATGLIIVGVTADEPMAELNRERDTLQLLKAYGVDVSDVHERGNFVFVFQKGYPYKTQFTKSVNNVVPPSTLEVMLRTDPSGPVGLKVEPVCKPHREDEQQEDKMMQFLLSTS